LHLHCSDKISLPFLRWGSAWAGPEIFPAEPRKPTSLTTNIPRNWAACQKLPPSYILGRRLLHAMALNEDTDFLDAGRSDDDGSQGYNSEDDFRKGGRSSKRRRVVAGDSEAEDFSDEEDEPEISDIHAPSVLEEQKTPTQDNEGDAADGKQMEHPGTVKPLTKKNLVASETAIKKSGVVFVARIPPFMKPSKLRSLLEPYGKVNRIFLNPEDDQARSRRLRGGGNRKKTFTEGWVEFVNKKDAKAVCEILNARTIGGKKGSYYRDDIWSLLYLKGFKWNHLTEQIANENAERASRMRAEISKTTKENKAFVRNVEQAKMLDGMDAKAAAKRKRVADDGEGRNNRPSGAVPTRTKRRSFKQNEIAKKRSEGEQSEAVTKVLSKIF